MKPTPIYVNVTGATASGKTIALGIIRKALDESGWFNNVVADEEGNVVIAELRKEVDCK